MTPGGGKPGADRQGHLLQVRVYVRLRHVSAGTDIQPELTHRKDISLVDDHLFNVPWLAPTLAYGDSSPSGVAITFSRTSGGGYRHLCWDG